MKPWIVSNKISSEYSSQHFWPLLDICCTYYIIEKLHKCIVAEFTGK